MQTQYLKVNPVYQFDQGFAVVETKRVGLRNRKEYSKVFVVDLETFLEVFQQASEFADLLENRANSLAIHWNNINNNRPSYERTPECYKYTLNSYSWINPYGVQERTVVEVCISSGGFTKLNLEVANASLEVQDLKITLKVKSTVRDAQGFNVAPCHKLISRGVGYTAPFYHFIGLLRDPALQQTIAEARLLKDEADNERCLLADKRV